jgi:hypothetical protein
VAVAAVLLPLGVVCLIYGMQVRNICWAVISRSLHTVEHQRQLRQQQRADAAGSTRTWRAVVQVQVPSLAPTLVTQCTEVAVLRSDSSL